MLALQRGDLLLYLGETWTILVEERNVLIVPAQNPDVPGVYALPNALEEILYISQKHHADILPEPVTWQSLINAVTGEKKYHIIHFLGHLTSDGFVVGGREKYLSKRAIRLAVSSGNFELVILNTCDSEADALSIATYEESHVICTICEIGDPEAASFAMAFYGTLLQAGINTYKQAFDAVRGGNDFRYIVGKMSPVTRGDAATREEFQFIKDENRAIKELLVGRFGEDGFTQRIRKLEDMYKQLSETVRHLVEFLPMLRTMEATYRSTTTIPTLTFYLLVSAVVVVGLILTYMTIRAGGG